MKERIRVYVKNPREYWREIEIANTLEELQRLVGGYIETFTFTSDACIICNEEGRLNGMRYNVTICGEHFFGPLVLVGVDGEDFTDCPEAALMLLRCKWI